MIKRGVIPGLVVMLIGLWSTGLLMAQTDSEKPQPGGDASLTVSIKGQHTQSFHGGQGWPFSLGGTPSVSVATLTKGGPDALKAVFGKLTDSANAGGAVSNVSGTMKVEGGKVSGHVKIEWAVQGNTMFVESDLEGTVSGSNVSISGKNAKAGGAWDWGGGQAEMGGSVSEFKAASK